MNITTVEFLLIGFIMSCNVIILLLTNHNKKIPIRILLSIDYAVLFILFSFSIMLLIQFKVIPNFKILIASGLFTILYDIILFNLIKIQYISQPPKYTENNNDLLAESLIHLSQNNKSKAVHIINALLKKTPESEIISDINKYIINTKDQPKPDAS